MHQAVDPACLGREGLAPAERLLLASLRAWFALRRDGRPPYPLIAPTFAYKTSGRSAAMFAAWVQAAESASSRPLEVDCSHCGGASSDMQRLVISCGLAPLDPALGAELIAPFVFDAEPVMVLGRTLNRTLAACGWRVPVRLAIPDKRSLH
jgi:hypothetical protein